MGILKMNDALQQRLVIVKRSIPDCHELRGSIVLENKNWLVLALLNDAVFYDGYVAVRRSDINEIVDASEEGFESRALKVLARNPESLGDLSARSASGLVNAMAKRYRLITVHREFRNPNSCVIGEIASVSRTEIQLHSITRKARFQRGTWTIPFSDITRIEWGGMYEQAIEAVLPKRRKQPG
jgi:hypothetical protein